MRMKQRGQALVETALVLPLLLVLMLAVGYFGHAVIAQQNMNIAARHAARSLAMESTSTAERRMLGIYEPTQEDFIRFAEAALEETVGKGQVRAAETTQLNHNYKEEFSMIGNFSAVTQQKHLYLYQEEVLPLSYLHPTPQDRNGQVPEMVELTRFGLGAVFYGGTLEYKLDELDPLAKLIFFWEKDPSLTVKGTSLMPAELPMRGGQSIMRANPWVGQVITQDVRDNSAYPDLIEE